MAKARHPGRDPEPRSLAVAGPPTLASTNRGGRWSLRAASSLEDYVANPFGRYIAGPTFAAYWTSTDLNGIVFWGRPDEDDTKLITRALDAVLIANRDHTVLIEASGLSSIDARAFATLASYMVTHRAAHSRLCHRQALVRPGGMAGAVVAGFYEIIRPSYPVAVFDELVVAVRWLELPDGGELVREFARIRTELQDTSSLVLARVRSLLRDEEQDLGKSSLDRIAGKLVLSPRTLQRRLVDAGTSFRAEVATARLHLAKNLLVNTDYDLKRIAFLVGCGSAAQFSAFFRRSTCCSPTDWRDRSRRG
jgi:AraC-like DNA-binding protein